MKSKDFEQFTAAIESERARISQRDGEILTRELTLMGQRTDLTNLDDYCRWLSPKQPKIVKWDLLRHYANNPDDSYLSVYQRNQGPINKPYHQDFPGMLLTHSLNGYYWEKARGKGFLLGHPNVSFSSGQVVFEGDASSGMQAMTVIFDRQVLEQVYTLQPYSDHEVEWEREVRAYEPISLDLAIGWIPTGKFLLELNHWGQLTCVCGKKIMADLEKHYLTTGDLKAVSGFGLGS